MSEETKELRKLTAEEFQLLSNENLKMLMSDIREHTEEIKNSSI